MRTELSEPRSWASQRAMGDPGRLGMEKSICSPLLKKRMESAWLCMSYVLQDSSEGMYSPAPCVHAPVNIYIYITDVSSLQRQGGRHVSCVARRDCLYCLKPVLGGCLPTDLGFLSTTALEKGEVCVKGVQAMQVRIYRQNHEVWQASGTINI